jgi:hypothetical protein
MICNADHRVVDVWLARLHLGTSRSHHGPPVPRKALNIDETKHACCIFPGSCFLSVLPWIGG